MPTDGFIWSSDIVITVAATFEEKQDLIPEIPLKIMVLSLIACVAFIIICSALGLTEWWQSAAFAAVSAAVIAVCLFVKVRITVDEANITVRRLRPYTVPLDHIIDVKKGDIDIMRNYSEWGIKKVKFRNYTVHGVEGAVSVKLLGRIVLTMTTARPDELYELLYAHRRTD